MSRENMIIISLMSIIFVLFLTKQDLLSTEYTQQPDYAILEKQIDSFKIQNNDLYIQYLNNTSYQYIASQAAAQGYIPANFIYLK